MYTGIQDDICPITHTPVAELSNPVGFDTQHAFEAESIVEWITQHAAFNPLTGQNIPAATLVTLVLVVLIVDGQTDHVGETQKLLDDAGHTISSFTPGVQVQIVFKHCPCRLRNETPTRAPRRHQ